jgi:hypothetical protein
MTPPEKNANPHISEIFRKCDLIRLSKIKYQSAKCKIKEVIPPPFCFAKTKQRGDSAIFIFDFSLCSLWL